MKFGGKLGSVIEKIENENSVCVVKVFGERDPRLRHTRRPPLQGFLGTWLGPEIHSNHYLTPA